MKNIEASSLDQIKMTKYWLEFDKHYLLILTKIHDTDKLNFTPKTYAGAVGLERSPSLGSQACTGWDTCTALLAPSLCSSTRKKHQARRLKRTPDVKLMFVGFNFGHVQLLRFNY